MATASITNQGGVKAYFFGLCCYLGVLVFVPLIVNRDNEFVHFHAKQGIVIWMIGVIGALLLNVPGVGRWFFSVSYVAVFFLSLAGLAAVLLNKAWKLPIVYTFAQKLW